MAEDYTEAVRAGSGKSRAIISSESDRMLLTICAELVEKLAFKQSPNRIEELVKIFIHATKVRSL